MMTTFMIFFLVSAVISVVDVAAFQTVITVPTRTPRRTRPIAELQQKQQRPDKRLFDPKPPPYQRRHLNKLNMVLYDPLTNSEHAESLFVDFPTSQQRTQIKKEMIKRRARKQLMTYRMPSNMMISVKELVEAIEAAEQALDDDDDDEDYYDMDDMEDVISDEDDTQDDDEEEDEEDEDDDLMLYETTILNDIWNHLQQHEAVQLKGVCRESKKHAYTVATWICAKLEERQYEEQQQAPQSSTDENEDNDDDDDNGIVLPVALIEVKGHTCVLYSPTLPLNHNNKFVKLRTSVGQKNTWTRREKAPRDHRGQIIPGWKEKLQQQQQQQQQ